jgi:hypothetical protein
LRDHGLEWPFKDEDLAHSRVTDLQFAVRQEIEPRLIGDDVKDVEQYWPPLPEGHHAAAYL